jgi:hypothetical protein
LLKQFQALGLESKAVVRRGMMMMIMMMMMMELNHGKSSKSGNQ